MADTQQTVQSTAYAPWTQSLQQALAGIAFGQNMGQLGTSGYSVAGFTPDQLYGMDQYRNMFGQFGPGNSFMSDMTGLFGGGQTMGQATDATAAQLSPTDYLPFMSQYVESNINPTIERLRRQEQEGLAEIAARGASQAGFGGSGPALQAAQLRRATGETTANTVGSMLTDAYNNANTLASGNVDREQAANLQNAAQRTNVSMSNASNALQGLGLMNSLANSDYERQMGLISALLGSGQLQQQQAQTAIDAPYDALARIAAYIPTVYNSTQTATSPDNSPGGWQQALGAGLTIAGMGTGNGSTVGGDLLTKLLGGLF